MSSRGVSTSSPSQAIRGWRWVRQASAFSADPPLLCGGKRRDSEAIVPPCVAWMGCPRGARGSCLSLTTARQESQGPLLLRRQHGSLPGFEPLTQHFGRVGHRRPSLGRHPASSGQLRPNSDKIVSKRAHIRPNPARLVAHPQPVSGRSRPNLVEANVGRTRNGIRRPRAWPGTNLVAWATPRSGSGAGHLAKAADSNPTATIHRWNRWQTCPHIARDAGWSHSRTNWHRGPDDAIAAIMGGRRRQGQSCLPQQADGVFP